MAACQNSGHTNQPPVALPGIINQKIPADDYDKKISATPNAQLIDVRTPEEYADGHLKNAVNINIKSGDFKDKINQLDKTKPVFVYCLSGGRSSSAANEMATMGFKEIYNLDGGIMKWRNDGKPVEQGNVKAKAPGLTIDEFNKMVAGEKYSLVDYNAKWCEPCKKMMPVLEKIAEKKKDKMILVKIDADDNKDLMKQKGISSIPYLELYQNGKLIWTHNGTIEKEEFLKETKL
jgi:thioredoxin